jgi:lysophospholipase L1-like esterase
MTAAPARPPAPAAAVGSALCIGDSVMLGASPQYLNTLSMCGTVDAELSRQFSGAPAAVAAHAPYPAAVVVHLGNNGTVDRDDVDAVMAHLAGVPRVVFVTVQLSGTRPWERQANGEIRATPGRYPNAVVADWKAASEGHPDFTRSDGIHMSPAGAGAYAATIAAAL